MAKTRVLLISMAVVTTSIEHMHTDAHLLSLPELSHLSLPPCLGSLSTSLGIEDKVPPPEAASVVANEFLMVHVVVLGASPKWQEVVQTPGKLVAAVRIDGLEQAERNPSVHGQDVEILGNGAPQDGDTDCSEAQNHDLDRGSVFSSQAERS